MWVLLMFKMSSSSIWKCRNKTRFVYLCNVIFHEKSCNFNFDINKKTIIKVNVSFICLTHNYDPSLFHKISQ